MLSLIRALLCQDCVLSSTAIGDMFMLSLCLLCTTFEAFSLSLPPLSLPLFKSVFALSVSVQLQRKMFCFDTHLKKCRLTGTSFSWRGGKNGKD